jgi:hypothetical protein
LQVGIADKQILIECNALYDIGGPSRTWYGVFRSAAWDGLLAVDEIRAIIAKISPEGIRTLI